MKKFIATLALLIVTGFAVSAQQSNIQEVGMCPPPPLAQDFIKKTVRVEIMGILTYRPGSGCYGPMHIHWVRGISQISAIAKTYDLDLNGVKDLSLRASKLSGQRVVVTGILHGTTVQVTDLKADDAMYKMRF